MDAELEHTLTHLAEQPGALSSWLHARIEEDHPDLPTVAAWLGHEGQIEALLVLMHHWVTHFNTDMLDTIRAALADHEDALCASLRSRLTHDAPEVRRGAAMFAGLLKLPQLEPALTAALTDEDILTRMAATQSLIQLNDPELLVVLTGSFESDPAVFRIGVFDDAEPRVIRHAIRLLAQHRSPCTEAALAHLITSHEDFSEDPISSEDAAVIDAARALLAEIRRA
ncbi:MAG: hypothetical protein ACI8S6_004390 [Myxococcota bacterium]|jgi:hypothetical protein